MNIRNRTVAIAACAALALSAGVARGVISGSPHDFSGKGWTNNVNNETCIACHTPHNAKAVTGAPLWNHEPSVATYTVYSSTSLNAGALGQPSGVSKLCLSCHDGTVAVDNFGGRTTGTVAIAAGANLGISLANDHPVSFVYNATLASNDGGLHAPAFAGTFVDAAKKVPLFGATGTLECASCHDVHDAANLGAAGSLLVKANTGSALCLTCHIK